jgi:hypothetical protein
MGSMNTRTVKNAAIEKARRIGFKGA